MVMFEHACIGKRIRLARLFRHQDNRLFIVPLDHSVANGPIATTSGLHDLVGIAANNGVDAIVVHKGRLSTIAVSCFDRIGLIVHLNASTKHAPDPNAKVMIATVEEAVRLGADAVSIHINVGSATEAQQLIDLGAVGQACTMWGIPLIAMMYPRGPKIQDPHEPTLVAHAASLAADLGADIVKTIYTGDIDSMTQVVNMCPIPIVAAGGSELPSTTAVVDFTRDVLKAGAIGVAIGRNFFNSSEPQSIARQVAQSIHPAV